MNQNTTMELTEKEIAYSKCCKELRELAKTHQKAMSSAHIAKTAFEELQFKSALLREGVISEYEERVKAIHA